MVLVAALSLAGCLNWEEAPEGATGFLVVDNVSLEGTVDGYLIEGTTYAVGYCTELGWHVELTAQAGDREIMNVIDVDDLALAERDAMVRFVSSGTENLAVDGLEEPGRMKLQSCRGVLDAPEYEAFATNVDLQIDTIGRDDDVRLDYVARFDNGDRVHGQFTMQMPVTD